MINKYLFVSIYFILIFDKGFYKDCPTGRLTKTELIKIYEELFPSGRAKKFCDLVFNVFDKNKTNTIGKSIFNMIYYSNQIIG